MRAESIRKLEELLDLIANPEIRVVSFDLFDTLLCRPSAFPRDLIELHDEEFRKIIKGFPLYSFRKDRFDLEDDLRNRVLKAGGARQEITLDEIYTHIQSELSLEDETTSLLKAHELEIEKRHLRVRHSAKSLFDAALENGKVVIIVSDMYLPTTFLESVLSELEIGGYRGLYVSSACNKKKKTGQLFRHVLRKHHCVPSEMLHIGDNLETDIRPALELGIRAAHFPKALDVFLSLDGNRHLHAGSLLKADLGYRVVLGLMANKIFDDPFRKYDKASLFNGEPWIFGYMIFGPLMFFMAKWIWEECLKDDVDEVLFLARDGYVLQKVYDALVTCFDRGPRSRYMYTSRNTFLPQTLSEKEYIPLTHHYVGISCRHITLRKLLVDRFGLEMDDELTSFFKRHGFSDFDSPIGTHEREILRTIKKCHARVVQRNREKRNLAKAYYEQFIVDGKKQVCFDIGWRGTSQLFLTRLLKKRIDFFYFTGNNVAFSAQAKYGYRAKPFMPFTNPFFLHFDAFQLVLEAVFGEPESSTCIGFEKEATSIVPVFSQNVVQSESKKPVQEIHQGILAFVADLMGWLQGDVSLLHAIPEHLVAPLKAFMDAPSKVDARALDQIVSENILASGNMLRLVDFWPQGKRSIEKQDSPATPSSASKDWEKTSYQKMKVHLGCAFDHFRDWVRCRFPRTTRFLLSPLYDLFQKIIPKNQ